MTQAIYAELSKDYSKLSKEELELKKEQFQDNLENSEYVLEVLKQDLEALKELKEIKFADGVFVRSTPMFKYEENPRFWEIQKGIAIRAADMEIKKKEDDVQNEEALLKVFKQLIAKADALL